ncbi:MAG TPA: IS21-like element helper ATPase IstB [Gemmatimonadales bacterium]
MSAEATGVALLLRSLKLPGFVRAYTQVAEQAEREGWGFERYLHHLAEIEIEDRRGHRIERLLRQSGLPQDKRLSALDLSRLPAPVRRTVPTLCEGGFVDRAENLLAFGLPGRGKTHLVCAIGHELVQRGYQVLFVPAFKLVQRLLSAKQNLDLEATLRRLDHFDAVILDDLGYVQQGRAEMEVLFTFLAERYERRSVLITSNLVFSEWDKIFQDPMTTACAIDRLVHHAVILELSGASYRADAAKRRSGKAEAS